MSKPVHRRRRLFGTACLAGAVVLLLLGQTWLKPSLAGLTFVVYWLVCFLLTGLTLVTALIDAQAVRREAREQQQKLLHEALQGVKRGDGDPAGSAD